MQKCLRVNRIDNNNYQSDLVVEWNLLRKFSNYVCGPKNCVQLLEETVCTSSEIDLVRK